MSRSNCWPVEVSWNYDRLELIADGIVHAVGVSLGLAGAIVIFAVAAHSPHAAEIVSIAVYSAGLLAMLGFSAAYNIWPVSHAKSVLRRFDHSAIFLMIAGTYTPFITQVKGDVVAIGFLVGVWLTAIAGIIVTLLSPGRLDRLSVVLYLLLGWSGAAVYEPIVAALPRLSIWLLGTGGALYSMGVVFYAWRSLRFQNAIWHAFVLVAACCHYFAVLFCVANRGLE